MHFFGKNKLFQFLYLKTWVPNQVNSFSSRSSWGQFRTCSTSLESLEISSYFQILLLWNIPNPIVFRSIKPLKAAAEFFFYLIFQDYFLESSLDEAWPKRKAPLFSVKIKVLPSFSFIVEIIECIAEIYSSYKMKNSE